MTRMKDKSTHERITFVKSADASIDADTSAIEGAVKEIIGNVRRNGDQALREYSRKFDQVDIGDIEISDAERQRAVNELKPETRKDSEFAIEQVRRFAEAQLETVRPLEVELIPGLHAGHKVIPIERIGAYVPGGTYPILAAPLMTILPAKVAGCDEVITCLPPRTHEAMIAVCHLCGADRIFRVGGAQAIAAMAYGTESIPSVNKIVGPGNAYVNEAKRQSFGPVGIDALAGPSEIFIVADETGNAEMIATDLLAQAEHDVRTRVGLITTDRALAEATLAEVERQLEDLSTADVAGPAWRDYGQIVLCEDEASMIAYSDFIAAEHLQVHTANPEEMANRLRNYGSLFVGQLASVVYSDKGGCGTNHTLPTMGSASYTGGLWVGAYLKVCTHQRLEQNAVDVVAPPAIRQSASEGMEGHRRAAALRFRK